MELITEEGGPIVGGTEVVEVPPRAPAAMLEARPLPIVTETGLVGAGLGAFALEWQRLLANENEF